MNGTLESKEDYINAFRKIWIDSGFNDCKRSFELDLTNFTRDPSQHIDEKIILGIIEDYVRNVPLENPIDSMDKKIAYAAFYCMTIIRRNRSGNLEELEELFNNYGSYFDKYRSFTHLKVLRCLYELRNGSTIFDEDLLEEDFKFASNHQDNAGFCHAFADLFVTICEMNKQSAAELIHKWYGRAISMVNHAIEKDPTYAKYYCTKGRILALKKENIKEAESNIRDAVMKEKLKSNNYTTRLNEYYYHLLWVQDQKQQQEINNQIENTKLETQKQVTEEIDNALKKNSVSSIEILTFFCGAISFLIGSVSIASEQDNVFYACLLIIVLAGSLLVVFSVFLALLRINDRKEIFSGVAIIGIVIILAAIAVGWVFLPHSTSNDKTKTNSSSFIPSTSEVYIYHESIMNNIFFNI